MNKNRPVVMLVNAVHSPFDTRIFQKEAISLSKAGYVVRIIIPHSQDDVREGIRIVAIPLPRKGWEQLIRCPLLIFMKALKEPPNSVFHVHDSELLVIAFWLRLLGRSVIYDAHEDTPRQIDYQHWIPQLIKKPYAWFYFMLEKMAGWLFSAIVVAEPIIARYYPQRKTVLIRNFSKVGTFKKLANENLYATRNNNLIYVGLISEPRGLFEMVKGAALAQPNVDFTFVLGGKFAPASLQDEILAEYKINYLGWVPYDNLAAVLCASKVGIITPHPNPRYTTNYPVKLFEYMAAGLPVIASQEGEAADFVREASCGMLVDPLNPDAIAEAITWLFSNPAEAEAMGKRGQELVMSKYNWELEEQRLLSLYKLFNEV